MYKVRPIYIKLFKLPSKYIAAKICKIHMHFERSHIEEATFLICLFSLTSLLVNLPQSCKVRVIWTLLYVH